LKNLGNDASKMTNVISDEAVGTTIIMFC